LSLTKAILINQIEKQLNLSSSEAKDVLETFLETMKSSLESGENLMISGFGKFQLQDKAPRKGRNPATGKDMILRSRRVVTFKCSGELRKKINGVES
jgi:integration host factor subunit alpha